jgi:hypothetical protein
MINGYFLKGARDAAPLNFVRIDVYIKPLSAVYTVVCKVFVIFEMMVSREGLEPSTSGL